MYAYIIGEVVHKEPEKMIIENNGIGYMINASSGLMEKFSAIGTQVKVHTYYYVREDQIALYGFPTREELSMFELLLTVSGIGPKVACNITGSMNPGQFALAVVTGDTKSLTSIKGIGKKGAERMILELKDKLKGRDMPSMSEAAADNMPVIGHQLSEAVSALMVLGYSGPEAERAVRDVTTEDNQSVENIIRLSLRQLAR
ncbi:MAG: Holliday junction branch migration protein RuvA [Clostridiaceae bacterium]|nr:Holliday junction branch migration protein RuvA [Clostridiaceae bacterium]